MANYVVYHLNGEFYYISQKGIFLLITLSMFG